MDKVKAPYNSPPILEGVSAVPAGRQEGQGGKWEKEIHSNQTTPTPPFLLGESAGAETKVGSCKEANLSKSDLGVPMPFDDFLFCLI